MARQTSVSDNGAFPEFCYLASKHDELFENFKVNPIYCQILPGRLDNYHVPLGAEFIKIFLDNPDFKLDAEKLKKILRHDSIGSPEKVTYTINDEMQITCAQLTPRYIKVASDIFSLFDTAKIKTVTEIGVGYAGQCNVLMSLLPNIEYNLVDLPEILSLAERCLTEIGQTDRIRYIDGTHLYHDLQTDLFISEFAFSELVRSVQDVYLEKIILKSKAGYITWNDGIDKKVWDTDGYTLEEILSLIPGAEAYFIPPKMYQGDQQTCTILWGMKQRDK